MERETKPSRRQPLPAPSAQRIAVTPELPALDAHHDATAAASAAVQASPRVVAQCERLQSNFGQPVPREPFSLDRRTPIQRRIHEWTEGQWKPGERGREGNKRFPLDGDGNKFFNDMTGESSPTLKGAAKTLTELHLDKGTVKDMEVPDANQGRLVEGSASLENVEREINKVVPKNSQAESVSYLGYFSFDVNDEYWDWRRGKEENAYGRGSWTDEVQGFLKGFMIANGQMDYIRTRDWYLDGSHGIQVDVNYYLNRRFGNKPFELHKDTGGANLFVNLIFSNKTTSIGTEVTLDTRQMGEAKKESLLLHMPQKQVDDLEHARESLKETDLAKNIVYDELQPHGYVSWVDELLWHSSPLIENRPKWSQDHARTALTTMRDEAGDPPQTQEAMVLIDMNPDTALSKYRVTKGMGTLTYQMAWSHFHDLGYNVNGANKDAVERDIQKVAWNQFKLNSAIGQDQDGSDPNVEKQKEITSPTGVHNRPRSLSKASEQQKWRLVQGVLPDVQKPQELGEHKAKLEEGPKQEEPKPIGTAGRNFLRTWVRVRKIRK